MHLDDCWSEFGSPLLAGFTDLVLQLYLQCAHIRSLLMVLGWYLLGQAAGQAGGAVAGQPAVAGETQRLCPHHQTSRGQQGLHSSRAVTSIPTLLLLLSDDFLILSPGSLPWAGPPRETPSGRSHCKK